MARLSPWLLTPGSGRGLEGPEGGPIGLGLGDETVACHGKDMAVFRIRREPTNFGLLLCAISLHFTRKKTKA